jgi:hypothetical protein
VPQLPAASPTEAVAEVVTFLSAVMIGAMKLKKRIKVKD